MKRTLFLISILVFIIAEIFIVKASADLTDGLIAYYPFNGNANDESGNGNHGTVYGAILAADQFGNPNNTYRFDGVNDRIEILDNDNLKITGSLTVGAFFKLDSSIAWMSAPIATKWGDGINGTAGYGLFVLGEGYPHVEQPGGKIAFAISSTGSDIALVNTPNPFPLNEWHHLAGVFNDSALKLYLDGNLVNEQTCLSGIYPTTAPFLMGSYNPIHTGGYVGPLNGGIDEVRIYNRALSEEEIRKLFHGDISLIIPDIATEGDGILINQGMVSVFSAPETDLVINLSSDDASLVAVPETVTIYAGQNSATFDIGILYNCVVNGSQTITITASAYGYVSGSDTIQIADNDISIEMNLPSGWSMISLPVIPCNSSISSLFPNAKVVYGYEKGTGYVQVKENEGLKVGDGYWILLDQNQNSTFTGQPIQSYPKIIYEDGWEMIGGCSYPAMASTSNCNIGVIYGYVQGIGYQRVLGAECLESGKGYWIQLRDVTVQVSTDMVDMNDFFRLLCELGSPAVVSMINPILMYPITIITRDTNRPKILEFSDLTVYEKNVYIDFANKSKIKIVLARLIDKNNNELLFFRDDIISKNYDSPYLEEINSHILGASWNYPEFEYIEYRITQEERTIIKPWMTLKTNQQITLKEGLYFFESLTLERNSILNTDGKVLVYVKKLELKDNAKMMGGTSTYPDNSKPNDLIILAQYWPGSIHNSEDGIKIGSTAKICGQIFAPDLKVILCRGSGGKDTRVYGSILTQQLVTSSCNTDPSYGPILIIGNLKCACELRLITGYMATVEFE